AEAGGNLLESVPQHGVGARGLVHGKVAFEHASARAEAIDRMQVVVAGGGGELIGGGRLGPPMPSEAVHRHVDSAELGGDIGAFRELRDIDLPLPEDFLALSLVGADSEGASEMVQNDRDLREGARQAGQPGDLMMIVPGIETESHLSE